MSWEILNKISLIASLASFAFSLWLFILSFRIQPILNKKEFMSNLPSFLKKTETFLILLNHEFQSVNYGDSVYNEIHMFAFESRLRYFFFSRKIRKILEEIEKLTDPSQESNNQQDLCKELISLKCHVTKEVNK